MLQEHRTSLDLWEAQLMLSPAPWWSITKIQKYLHMIIIAQGSGVDYVQYDDNYAIQVEQKRQMKLTKYGISFQLWKQSELQYFYKQVSQNPNVFKPTEFKSFWRVLSELPNKSPVADACITSMFYTYFLLNKMHTIW